MPNLARLNDPTTHGGTITNVSATHFTVGGMTVPCERGKCSCPCTLYSIVEIAKTMKWSK